MEHNISPYVITISRQMGSGGRQIGHILAQQFNIAYYDTEILSQAAAESGLGPNVFEINEERRKNGFFRQFIGAVQPFIGGGDFYAHQLSEEAIFDIQSRVISKVASERSCIFVGRVADYILRDHPRCAKIFIAANMDERTRRIMDEKKVDFKTAVHIIEEGDEKRAGYYNFHSNGTWGSADTYDLCINTSVLGIEKSIDLIKEFITLKLGVEIAEENQQPLSDMF